MPDRLDFQQLSSGLRRMGWIRFWSSWSLGLCSRVLVFAAIGGSTVRDAARSVGLGTGISLTTLAFVVLLFSLWQGWLVVRTGRAIDSPARPSRGETARRIKRSLLADLLGLVLALLGYQALAGPLFIQAASQTPGVQVDNLPITATEIVVVLGNAQALFAHLIDLLFPGCCSGRPTN